MLLLEFAALLVLMLSIETVYLLQKGTRMLFENWNPFI